MQIYPKASLRAGGASHRSRTFGNGLDVMISPSRLDDDARNFYIGSTFSPEIYRQSLVRRAVLSLVRLLLIVRPCPYRLAPAAGESCGAHICPIPCSLFQLMPSPVHPYPHGPPANVATLPAPIDCLSFILTHPPED